VGALAPWVGVSDRGIAFVRPLRLNSFRSGCLIACSGCRSMQELWAFVVDNRETFTWLGGGIAAAAGGIWAVIKHYFPEAKAKKSASPTSTVRMSGTGIASGRDIYISAPVSIGADEQRIRHVVELALQPLNEKFERIIAKISLEKDVPVPPLRNFWRESSESGLPLENLPKVVNEKADSLARFRQELARIEQRSPDLAPLARRAQISLDRGDFLDARDALDDFSDPLKEDPDRLLQEVQILMQNWKMITDMSSNLSKTLHEMAMTAVRNIR